MDLWTYTWKWRFLHLPSLSLTNSITSLVDYLTACKRLWRLCVVARTSDSKNPELYYYYVGWETIFLGSFMLVLVLTKFSLSCWTAFSKFLDSFTFSHSLLGKAALSTVFMYRKQTPSSSRTVAYWELARGQEDLLHKPVRLYSFRQNFCVLVWDLYWQKDWLMMDQITSSCCILAVVEETLPRPKINYCPQKLIQNPIFGGYFKFSNSKTIL